MVKPDVLCLLCMNTILRNAGVVIAIAQKMVVWPPPYPILLSSIFIIVTGIAVVIFIEQPPIYSLC